MSDEKKRCYTYTRVSTEMQTEGYSLDAQKNALQDEAKRRNLEIIREFTDAGKSGKNTAGRPQFTEMMSLIQEKPGSVDYVLVYDLSRFGRNTADILSNIQMMQDYGVELISVHDNLVSNDSAGKMMISLLATFAELERENIITRTSEGRKEKALEGKWNGGQAPYGYKIGEDDVLQINEDEAPLIREIFGLYTDGGYGIGKTADVLNKDGWRVIPRGNVTHTRITADFVKRVLDNPVYAGKIAYGRRKKKKIEGKRNEYTRVKSDDYEVVDGSHEPIISEELWQRTRQKRDKSAIKKDNHSNSPNHYVLTGLVRCPVCGGPMYGVKIDRKKKDGTYYKPIYYYTCNNHRSKRDGPCSYGREIREEVLDAQVAQALTNLLKGSGYLIDLTARSMGADEELDSVKTTIEDLNKRKKKLEKKRAKHDEQIRELDIEDEHYNDHYDRLVGMIDECSDEITELDNEIKENENLLQSVTNNQQSFEDTYKAVVHFMYNIASVSPELAQQFYHVVIESIQIYPDKRPDGLILKSIKLKFPVYFGKKPVSSILISDDEIDENDGGIDAWESLSNDLKDICESLSDDGTDAEDSLPDDGTDAEDNSTDNCLRNQSPDETAMQLVRCESSASDNIE